MILLFVIWLIGTILAIILGKIIEGEASGLSFLSWLAVFIILYFYVINKINEW